MIPQRESDLMRTVRHYLDLHRIFYWRNNSGAFKTPDGRWMSFGKKGSADFIAVVDGRLYAIECKAPKGKQSPEQKEWQRDLEAAGGSYLLVFDVDTLIEQLPTKQRRLQEAI